MGVRFFDLGAAAVALHGSAQTSRRCPSHTDPRRADGGLPVETQSQNQREEESFGAVKVHPLRFLA